MIRKMILSIVFSLVMVLLPMSITMTEPCHSIGQKNQMMYQVGVNSSYSVCEAMIRAYDNSNDKSSKKKQSKKVKKEASIGYTIGGFIFAYMFCDILLGVVSFTASRSVFGIDEGEACSNIGLLYLLAGIVFFGIRCLVNGLVGNMFDYSVNIMGVLKGFDYCCWFTLIQFWFNRMSKSLGNLGFITIVGYVVGNIMMEILFG